MVLIPHLGGGLPRFSKVQQEKTVTMFPMEKNSRGKGMCAVGYFGYILRSNQQEVGTAAPAARPCGEWKVVVSAGRQ